MADSEGVEKKACFPCDREKSRREKDLITAKRPGCAISGTAFCLGTVLHLEEGEYRATVRETTDDSIGSAELFPPGKYPIHPLQRFSGTG